MGTGAQEQELGIKMRRLGKEDLATVVALDAANAGRLRSFYFQRRLGAALAAPDLHVQLGAERDGKVVGFIMARLLRGQFGRSEWALRLEAMGVEPGVKGEGIGSALLTQLQSEARRLKAQAIRTGASWRDHRILKFFDHGGFELANNLVLDCAVHGNRLNVHESDRVLAPTHLTGFSTTEVDYSANTGNDAEALARDSADVRTLRREDLDDIVRIDQAFTGRRRQDYIGELVEEALSDSAVRVSLVARLDGITAGFVMARTDFGDFGRAEPVAILDTLGVTPAFARCGLGHALLSQLFVNLQGLRVERVETAVARDNFGLLGFLYKVGFAPSERLGFVKHLV